MAFAGVGDSMAVTELAACTTSGGLHTVLFRLPLTEKAAGQSCISPTVQCLVWVGGAKEPGKHRLRPLCDVKTVSSATCDAPGGPGDNCDLIII
jgi:hypothetical protein